MVLADWDENGRINLLIFMISIFDKVNEKVKEFKKINR